MKRLSTILLCAFVAMTLNAQSLSDAQGASDVRNAKRTQLVKGDRKDAVKKEADLAKAKPLRESQKTTPAGANEPRNLQTAAPTKPAQAKAQQQKEKIAELQKTDPKKAEELLQQLQKEKAAERQKTDPAKVETAQQQQLKEKIAELQKTDPKRAEELLRYLSRRNGKGEEKNNGAAPALNATALERAERAPKITERLLAPFQGDKPERLNALPQQRRGWEPPVVPRSGPDVTLYGYRIWDDIISDSNGFVSFQTTTPATVNLESSYADGSNSVYAGEYVDGYIYLYSVDNYSSPENFIKVSADDWSEVAKVSIADYPIDMAYDYTTSTMYGIKPADYTSTDLYSIDLDNGDMTYVASLSGYFLTLACDPSGQLFGVAVADISDYSEGILYKIDKSNGSTTEVGSTSVYDPYYIQSMAFDQNSGRLFWAMCDYYGTGELIELNPATGAVDTYYGIIGTNAEIVALHTLYTPPAAYAKDAELRTVLSPLQGGSANAAVTVVIRNRGSDPITSLNVSYTFNGGGAVTESFTGSLAYGDAATFTFSTSVNVSAFGNYSLTASVSLTGDENPANDSKTVSFNYSQPFYGYRLYPSYGVISFQLNTPTDVTTMSTYTDGNNAVSSGEYLNKYLYLTTSSSGVGKNLIQLSTDDWSVVSRKPLSPPQQLSDMAYDYTTHTMYGILSSGLYTVNLETGAVTSIATMNVTLITLACHTNGTLYGISTTGNLYTINKTTGVTTLVGPTGLTPNYLQSMAFDHNSGKLYWAFIYDVSDGGLYEVNTTTGAADYIGLIGSSSEVAALHTPYIAIPGVPNFPTDFTAVPDAGGALSCELSWTNPAVTAGGDPLTELTSVVVTRDNVPVYTVSTPVIGGVVTWTDYSSSNGTHTYAVYGINGAGTGYVAYQTVFVGIDPCTLPATLPLIEGFEGAVAPPACWTSINLGSTSNAPTTVTTPVRSGSQSWRFSSYYSSTNYNQYLITPEIATGKVKEVKFYYRTSSSYGTERFRVGYSLMDTDVSSFTWGSEILATNNTSWLEYTATIPANAKYVAINYCVSSDQYYLYIDDFSIMELPDQDAAVISIDSPPSQAIGLTGSEQVSITIKNKGAQSISNVPVVLEVNGVAASAENTGINLNPGESAAYTFTATANLSASGSHTLRAYTDLTGDELRTNDTLAKQIYNCGAVISFPWTEGFEGATFPPECWTTLAVSGPQSWTSTTNTTYVHSGTKAAWRGYASGNQNNYLITKPIRLQADGVYELTFWSRNQYPGDYGKNSVLISTNGTVASDFAEIWTTSSVGASWEQTTIQLPSYLIDTDIYIAFRYEGNNAHSWALDDISITKVPDRDASVLSIDTPPAQGFGWTATEPVSITVKNNGLLSIVDLSVGLEVDGVPVTPVNEVISDINLAPGSSTTYTFTATADLSASGSHTLRAYTALSGEEYFANDTLSKELYHCGAIPVPWSENFDAATFPPTCWSLYDNTGASGQWVAGTMSGYYRGVRSAYHADISGNQDDWLISLPLSLPTAAGGLYELKFWSYIYYADYYGNNSVWISKGSSNPADGDFVEVWTPGSVTNGWKEEEPINLSDYAGETIYIAFRYQGVFAHRWAVDDVAITPMPENDLKITPVFPIEYPQVPKSQFVLTANAKNVGTEAQTNVVLNVSLNGSVFGPSAAISSLAAGSASDMSVTVPPASVPIGPISATYTVSANETDERPADNSATLSFTGTNNVYAYDNLTAFTNGVGNSSAMSFGNIFPIQTATTLSQVAVGFSSTVTALDYTISLYKMTGELTFAPTPLFTQPAVRSGGLNCITVPATPLEAGERYFLCVDQLSADNILVSYQSNANKRVYAITGPGVLYDGYTGYGAAIRMVLESADACPAPTGLNVSATTYSGTFTWTGTALSYIVTLDDGVTTSTYSVSGNRIVIPLSDGTAYTWTVRGCCDATHCSADVPGPDFTTVSCGRTLPLIEGFNTSSLPACWQSINLGSTSNVPTSSTTRCEDSRSWRFSSYNLAAAYDQYLITPHLINATGGEITVSFQYKVQSTAYGNEHFRVGYSTTNNNISSFIWVDDIEAANTMCLTYTKQIPCDAKFVAIHYYSPYIWYLYVDDFNISAAAAPTTVDVAVTDLTVNTSGTLSANEPVQVTVLNKGIAATNITLTCTVNCTQTQVISLGTCEKYTHTFYFDMSLPLAYQIEASVSAAGDVQSNNDTLRTSVGVNALLERETVAYWDFEDGQIPDGFTMHNLDNATSYYLDFEDPWVPFYDDYFDRNVVVSTSYFLTDVTANRWLITSGMTLPLGAKLSWLGATYDPGYPDGYEVRLSTTGTDPDDFSTVLFSIAAENEDYTYREVDLSAYAGQTVHIAFRQNSYYGFLIMIDDIKIEGEKIYTVCSGDSFVLNPPAPAGIDVSWTRAATPGINGGASGSGSGPINEVLTNNTSAPITVTYIVTFTANGCGTPEKVFVVVQPKLALTSPVTQSTICSHTEFNYTATASAAGAAFSWQRIATPGIVNSDNETSTLGLGDITETLINTTHEPITVTYRYTITYEGCSDTQDITVLVNPRPTQPALQVSSGSLSYCEDRSLALTAESINAASYTWTFDGSSTTVTTGLYEVVGAAVGTHTITVVATSAEACASEPSSAVISVNALPAAPTLTASASTFCAGAQVSSTLTADAGTVTVSSYFWYKNGQPIATTSGNTYAATATGRYSVRITSAAGCESPLSDVVEITVLPLPTTPIITVNGPSSFCPGSYTTLTANSPGASSYTWYNGVNEVPNSNAPTLQVTEGGNYSVKVVSYGNCPAPPSNVASITVYPAPLQPSIAEPDGTPDGTLTLCEGEAEMLLPVSPDGNYTYRWYKNGERVSIGTDYRTAGAGAYRVDAVSAQGCVSPLSEPLVVVVNRRPSLPVITPNEYLAKCAGEPLILTATSEGAGSLTWYKDDVEVQRGISRTYEVATDVPGVYEYSVQATSYEGCLSDRSARKQVVIEDYPSEPELLTDRYLRRMRGTSASFSVRDVADLSYLWYFGPKPTPQHQSPVPVELAPGALYVIPSVQLADAGEYFVIAVTPQAGCLTKSAPIQLDVLNDIVVKNIVTPNGDNQNEFLEIEGLETYESNEVRIVNRYGNEVYRQANYHTSSGWKGENLPDGVYFYSVRLTEANGTVTTKNGYVTLKR